MRRKVHGRSHHLAVGLVCLALLFPIDAFPITHPLAPEDVQNAYSLGKTTHAENLNAFLSQYQRTFAYPSSKPFAYLQFVEFQTPYEQIVLRSRETPGYSKFQAADDYKANPGLIRVRVLASLRNDYSGPVPPEDSFQVAVSQARGITPRDVDTSVPCNPYNPLVYSTVANCEAYTREIDLTFDVSQFLSGRVRVKVMLPQSADQEIVFDLSRLK